MFYRISIEWYWSLRKIPKFIVLPPCYSILPFTLPSQLPTFPWYFNLTIWNFDAKVMLFFLTEMYTAWILNIRVTTEKEFQNNHSMSEFMLGTLPKLLFTMSFAILLLLTTARHCRNITQTGHYGIKRTWAKCRKKSRRISRKPKQYFD